jgi:hypothetical protein
MPMQPPKRLPVVLARHAEGGRLKEAFDRVNAMRDTRTYDRTTLPRWLSGESIPSDERFIRALADELGDQEIVSASVDDRCGTNREVLDLLTRFRRLSAAHKRDVRALINESFRDTTATRTSFTMRIDLHGGLTEHCHRLDLSLGWVGCLTSGSARTHNVSSAPAQHRGLSRTARTPRRQQQPAAPRPHRRPLEGGNHTDACSRG